MGSLPDLADMTNRIHTELHETADLRRVIARDNATDYKVHHGVETERLLQSVDEGLANGHSLHGCFHHRIPHYGL
jgi:fatty acid synthase subunit beta